MQAVKAQQGMNNLLIKLKKNLGICRSIYLNKESISQSSLITAVDIPLAMHIEAELQKAFRVAFINQSPGTRALSNSKNRYMQKQQVERCMNIGSKLAQVNFFLVKLQ